MQYVAVPFAGVLGLARGADFAMAWTVKSASSASPSSAATPWSAPTRRAGRWGARRPSMPSGQAAQNRSAVVFRRCDPLHTKANGENNRAAIQNVNHAQSLATLDRMAAVLKEHNAQPWSEHEPGEIQLRKYARTHYE